MSAEGQGVRVQGQGVMTERGTRMGINRMMDERQDGEG